MNVSRFGRSFRKAGCLSNHLLIFSSVVFSFSLACNVDFTASAFSSISPAARSPILDSLQAEETTRCTSTTSINLHTYIFHSNSASSDSFHSAMFNPSGMDIEPNLDGFNHQQPFTPSPTPAQTGEQDPNRPIVITLAMYNNFMNRLTYVESYNDNLRDRCATLAEQNASLSTQCVTLSTQYVNLSNQLQNNLSNHLQSHPSTLEPKIADAPPFSGNRKDLLPFLTKCRLKF